MTEHFTVTYDGPALQDHRIPVTALAPALLALSEMFVVAHQITSDGVSLPPALEVRATREGSFAIELTLSPEAVVDLFNSREAIAGATAVALFSPVVNALRYWKLARRLGREPDVAEVEPGEIRISWPDGTEFNGPASTKDLVESMDFRRCARAALAPLEANVGIDTMELRSDDKSVAASLVLERADSRDFDSPPGDDELITDSVRTVGLNPLKPSFEAGYKWWVSDGLSRFWVTMHDLAFVQRVETSREVFTAGDILRCRVRDRQLRDSEGELRMEHIVVEVLEHLQSPPPDELAFQDDD